MKPLPSHLEEKFRSALKAIIDPDLQTDIVTAGMVELLRMEAGHVYVDLRLTTPACPFKEAFKSQITEALLALNPLTDDAGTKVVVEKVTVNLTATGSRSSAARKLAVEQSTLKTVGSVIAVASCKGGVGKSTIAALVACEFARRGHRVGLLDADIFGPSAPTLFQTFPDGVKSRDKKLVPITVSLTSNDNDNGNENTSDNKNNSNHKNTNHKAMKNAAMKDAAIGIEDTPSPTLKLMSFGFLLGNAPAVMRGAMVANYMTQVLHQVDWGELDYLFIDLPPGTGDTVLTLAQSVTLTGAVVVTTPAPLALVDVERGIAMLKKVNVPILGVVSNMGTFLCPSCGKTHDRFPEDLANKVGGVRKADQATQLTPPTDAALPPTPTSTATSTSTSSGISQSSIPLQPSDTALQPIISPSEQAIGNRLGAPLLGSLPLLMGEDVLSFTPYVSEKLFPAERRTPSMATDADNDKQIPSKASFVATQIKGLGDQLARAIGLATESAGGVPKIETSPGQFLLTFPPRLPSQDTVATPPGVAREQLPQGEASQENNTTQEKRLQLAYQTLRGNCPCALCQDEFTGKRKITPADIAKDITPTTIRPVGSYAVAIEWSDGHKSGIYSYKLIETLAEAEKALG